MSGQGIYNKLPRFLQNIMVSLYGIKRNHMRFGGSFSKQFDSVIKSYKASEEEIKEYQEKKLRELFIAASNSVHYGAIFKKLKVDVYKDDCFEIFKKMPILKKDQLRGHEKDFFTGKNRGDQVFHTSGSTGTPLTIVMNVDDFRLRMAILERIKTRYGISHKDKYITFVGKKITKDNDTVFWRNNVFGHQLVMSVYDLSEKNKYAYLNRILTYKPHLIEGYPSAITVIAKWVLEEHYDIKPKAVFLTAETFTEDQRQIIEKAFCCPVVNYYGSSEGAPIISQCLKGNLHLDYESGIIEFLDENGNEVSDRGMARMIITSFSSKSTPLIRYDIGDVAMVSDKVCDCGCHTQVVEEIIGRMDDVFETPDKGYIGRLSTSLKLLPSRIKRAQIQQTAPTEFILLIESADVLSDEEINVILSDLYYKLGNVAIEIQYVEEIPIGKNGKFRTQIKMF